MVAGALPTPRPGPSDHAGQRPIRLLIVDDSAVARAVFSRMLLAHDGFEIMAMLPDAARALAFLADHRVDVILLDIEMPGMDGLTAMPQLIEAGRGARILIVSSAAEVGAQATLKALALGAADTLAKPGTEAFRGRFAETLAEKLRRLACAARGTDADSPLAVGSAEPVGCLAIGASTGGIHALADLFRALPVDFNAPILVTQHLPANFMPYFASQVAAMAGRPARVAEDAMLLRPGTILIAPGDAHLGLGLQAGRPAVALGRAPAVSGCLPSVDAMLAGVADIFGVAGLGIVLSGMGRDGQEGAGRLVAAGGTVLAQDRASSVVWGMPGAVARAGLASAILPPHDLGARVPRRGRA